MKSWDRLFVFEFSENEISINKTKQKERKRKEIKCLYIVVSFYYFYNYCRCPISKPPVFIYKPTVMFHTLSPRTLIRQSHFSCFK